MDMTSRRKFLAAGLGGIGAVLSGGILYSVYRYLSPRHSGADRQRVTFPESEVPSDGAKFFDYNGSSGVVIRTKNGDLAAFSAVCTHLGCIVQWEKEKQGFLCPCHAGRYGADGAVLSGPPPKPLPKLPLSVTNGTVTVG